MGSMAELFSLVLTYPYNIIAGTALVGVSYFLIRRHVAGGVCHSKARLDGKTAIITGANTGIGLETAVDFAERNGRVILACRSRERGEAAVTVVKRRSGNNNVLFMELDLSSLDSVRGFCTSVLNSETNIDILVNNAGVMMCPYSKTRDGFEMQFGTNHLGHFLLTNLLLDRIKEGPSGRIVNVSSLGYKTGKIKFDDINSTKAYDPYAVYCQSKLANVLFTRSLAKRLEGTRVTANSLHPGIIKTELSRHFSFFMRHIATPLLSMFFKTPWEGAQTSIYCGVSEEMEGVSGQYLADCKIKQLVNPQATDDHIAERLWEVSEEMVGLNQKQ